MHMVKLAKPRRNRVHQMHPRAIPRGRERLPLHFMANGGDQVTIRITARVLDLPINTNGRQVENDAQATISAPTDPNAPGGTLNAGDSALADIVVPRYLLDKAVDRIALAAFLKVEGAT